MQFTIQVSVKEDCGETTIKDIISLDKVADNFDNTGLSLMESKNLLKSLQNMMVSHQAELYTKAHINCPQCQKKRRVKGHHDIQYRTLFGIVPLSSLRVYNCDCKATAARTTSLLTGWISDHNSPELQYIETKWASLMAYGLTANLLKDILPVGAGLNASTVRNHLHKVARHQESDLKGKPEYMSGCAYEWGNLPKPGKPITVGIDGGYVRNWHDKGTNFEVIAGKAFSKEKAPKRFGFVQKIGGHPRRKLMNMLEDQGMQNNQQITFLSDGADNLRDLQFMMYPDSLHVLDWFHVTMRFTVLSQFAKGMKKSDRKTGAEVLKDLESAKGYLWHGNVKEALEKIDACCAVCDDDELDYENLKKFYRHLSEIYTYIENNQPMIPNYGERYRYGEIISTAFVESTINEVVAKRMVKKQQMQWCHTGAHYLLQTRTSVLNGDLKNIFYRWHPGLKIEGQTREQKVSNLKLAA